MFLNSVNHFEFYHIAVSDAQLSDLKMLPGMPAEVMIRVGSRSMVDYLMEPLLRTLRRSMRES